MRSRSGTFALICFDGAIGAANFRVGIVDSFKWFESNEGFRKNPGVFNYGNLFELKNNRTLSFGSVVSSAALRVNKSTGAFQAVSLSVPTSFSVEHMVILVVNV